MHSVGMLALVAGMPLTYTVRDCGTRRGTLYDTGFLPSTLQTAWDKYSGAVGNVLPPTRSDHKRIVWWYLYLMWAHRNHDPRGTGFDGVGQGRFRQWFSTMSADLFNDQVLCLRVRCVVAQIALVRCVVAQIALASQAIGLVQRQPPVF